VGLPGARLDRHGRRFRLDEHGEPEGTFDVYDYVAICKEHYEKVGIGADYVDALLR
jgi:2,4'-dihydroxyacetophenone dioxygenase